MIQFGFMDISLEGNMKKLFLILLICTIMICCVGCEGYEAMGKYPHFKSACWYCEDLDFTINYEFHKDGHLKEMTYPLHWEGKTYDVYVWFMFDNWEIAIDNGDSITESNEQLLLGTWKYKGNNLILTITEDNLLNGQYEKLVFVPMN